MKPYFTPSRMPALTLSLHNLAVLKRRIAGAFDPLRKRHEAGSKSIAARQPWAALMLALVLSLVGLISLDGWRSAASQSAMTASSGQHGLAAALNPDGTLKPGANGSFDTSGFRMEYSATGAPRFVAAPPVDAWDTQFNLPNGVGIRGQIIAMAAIGTNIYVAGSFTAINNIAANNVAKFDTLTSTWSKLGTGNGNGVNSFIYALLVSGSDLYVGGAFTTANVGGATVSTNRIAKFDTTTGVWSKLGAGSGNGVNSNVGSLLLNGSDLYVGGQFTTADVNGTNISANRIAQFNTTTGVWGKLGTGNGNGVSSEVRSMILSGGDLYVGGDFTTANVGGTGVTPVVTANYVAKFNPTTGWSKLGTNGNGLNTVVFTLLLSGSDLYMCGDFTTANVGGTTVTVNRVAKFDTTTNTWSKLGTGSGNGVSGNSSRVQSMALSGTDLYVGGSFTSANTDGTTVSATRVAKFDTTNNTWSKLGTGTGTGVGGVGGGAVQALLVSGSDLYVGGFAWNVANVGGTPPVSANRLAKFDTLTSTWSAPGTGVGNGTTNINAESVTAIVVSGTNIYVGGVFEYAGTVAANRVAKFDTTTNTWSVLGTGGGNGVNGRINALALSGNDLYVGGSFALANVGGTTVTVDNVAKVDTTTGVWSKLGTGNGNGVNHIVRALALSGSGDLFVGGDFAQANTGGTTVGTNRVAKYNLATGAWSALRNGTEGNVHALAVSGSNLYVGGNFTQVDALGPTLPANRVAKWDMVANTWSKLGTNGNGVSGGANVVYALAASGSDLYVGGLFSIANEGGTTVSVNNVAKVNTTTGVWRKLGTGSGNGVNSWVHSLALRGSELFVGGEGISNANTSGITVSTSNLAKVDTTTGVWSAIVDPGGGNGANFNVHAIAMGGSYLYIGGWFDLVGDNKPSSGFGRFFSANTAPTITAGATVARQQGTTGTSATIATVSDNESAASSITVTATTVPTGISITGITNINGTVTATVAAGCSAATGNNTVVLTATDGTLSSTANFIVNVTANTAPTVGTYANTTLIPNASTTVTPSVAPADNGGMIAAVTATASPNTFTGTFSGDTTTGAVTITNAGPAGNYTITVTVTDNCGAIVQQTFTLTVISPLTITAGATATRQQGTAGSTATIATVGNGESGGSGVTVTATTVPAGISITGITNTNGTVTATVAASCTAALGNNTVVLTATDGNGATATANYTVTVTANSAPSVGTYANTGVAAGGNVTVTPSVAPADNGSIASVTATATPNTFTGMLSGETTTGALTITNAGPSGTYSITVTVTDNCGATVQQTFTLTINSAPTINAVVAARQQGSPVSNVTIANIGDLDQAANTLTVQVNNGASATVTGVMVSNLVSAANGVVSADVVADCTAANAVFTLKVTDNNGATATATLNVTVTANTAPVLTYGNQTVGAAGSLTINPATEPRDNGSVASLTVLSVTPALLTAPTVASNGIVTITNAGPSGSHTVTIRAIDNCGMTTDASFTLNVTCPTLMLSPASIPGGIVGQPYLPTSFSAAGGNGTVSYSLSGTLPTGMSFVSGQLADTPTESGSFPITVTATDAYGCSTSKSYTLVISCPDILISPSSLPIAQISTAYSAQTIAASGGNAPYTITLTGALPTGMSFTSNQLAGTPTVAGTFPLSFNVKDKYGCTGSRNLLLQVNRPPVALAQNVTVTADATCSANADINNGSNDPDGDTLTLTQTPAGPYAVGTRTVTLSVSDSSGSTRTTTATVTVEAPKPVPTITSPVSGAIYAVGVPINFTGTFTDLPGTLHTASWKFDTLISAGTVVEPVGTTQGTTSVARSFTTPGVYLVTLTVTNQCGGAGSASTISADQLSATSSADQLSSLVVIYDPNGGFVTGGGWINSPAGAYAENLLLTGKANFGFVSKYKNGSSVPSGETEFQFKAGNLNFKSTVYEWMVIAGARAQYKGSGKINGAGDYRFMLTAIDGQVNGGGGQDKFRIRIWNNAGGGLVYDNQSNAPDSADPTTLLGGGSIVIHK